MWDAGLVSLCKQFWNPHLGKLTVVSVTVLAAVMLCRPLVVHAAADMLPLVNICGEVIVPVNVGEATEEKGKQTHYGSCRSCSGFGITG